MARLEWIKDLVGGVVTLLACLALGLLMALWDAG